MFKLINRYFQDMFTFKGRIARKDYWLTILVSIPIALLVNVLLQFRTTFVVGLSFCVILTIANFSLICRRLHDINSSGFIVLAYFVCLVISAIMSVPALMGSQLKIDSKFLIQDLSPVVFGIFSILTVILSIIIFISTVTKGSETANKYGEVPERIVK